MKDGFFRVASATPDILGRFFIEGIRTDSLIVPYLGIRVSQVFSLAIVVMSCVLLGIKSYKHRKNT